MNVLFASSELSPYAKAGGLGDVMESLPSAFREAGHSVSLVVPLYRSIRDEVEGIKPTEIRLEVVMGGRRLELSVWHGVSNMGVSLFAVECDEFFDRSGLYGNGRGDYFDNGERYVLFSLAVVELIRYVRPKVDLVHVNDWHTGLIPLMVKAQGMGVKTVFTIHNLAYQGVFPRELFTWAGLPPGWFMSEGVEYYGQMNFMKAGIYSADWVTTVSPRYAEEIQTKVYGCGLDGVLRDHGEKVSGVMNGINEEVWNPEKDAFLIMNYSRESMEGKEMCKRYLLKRMGFEGGESRPLFGWVGRLVSQKGVDLLLEMITPFLNDEERNPRLVVLGSGEKRYEAMLVDLAEKYPDRIGVQVGFHERLSHEVIAGSDFFLMPSLFEPCGLTQMYSQCYGTVPVVRAVGGLVDSVENWESEVRRGSGLCFRERSGNALWREMERGMKLRDNVQMWEQIRANGMERDFSWKRRVGLYEELYNKIL